MPASRQAKCWMAESFPLSLEQLLPILDIVGYANKHLKRVRTRAHFPVYTRKRKHETQPDYEAECWYLFVAGGEIHAEVQAAGFISHKAASAAPVHRLPRPAQQVSTSAADPATLLLGLDACADGKH